MKAGYDLKTIRDYLVKRGTSSGDFDIAVDYIFAEQKKGSLKKTKHEISIVVGLFFLILVFISMMYFAIAKLDLSRELVNKDILVIQPEIQESTMAFGSGCKNIVGDEQKYGCYVTLFEKDFLCDKINDDQEKDFCYRAKDIQLLSA